MRNRLLAQFDVARACEDLRTLNQDVVFTASDFLVGREFTPYECLLPGEAARGVVMIDGLWATQLFREPGAVSRLIRLYEENREAYQAGLWRLRDLTLENDPAAVQETAARMLGTLLDPAKGHEHYSFATKLFHWHAPEHLPIVDSRARKAINLLQKTSGQGHGIVLSDMATVERGGCVNEYGRWIGFYSELIQTLTPDDRQVLWQADKESLPPQFRRENTLLRILDKVFYRRGRERKATGGNA